MSSQRMQARERAAAERARARALRAHAGELRKQAELLSGALVATLRRVEGPPLGERGDAFSLRLPRLPLALGLLRQELRRWLERRGVGRDDTAAITLACSEACANAIEHPRAVERPAVEVDARTRPSEVEVVVRDFGTWAAETSAEAGTRGRGLEMIRSLMDDVTVAAGRGGTRVTMRRRLVGRRPAQSSGSPSK